MTTEESIQRQVRGSWENRRAEMKCEACGVESSEKALVMPERLPYEEAKLYDGPMYCLSHAPRFGVLPRLSFERVL